MRFAFGEYASRRRWTAWRGGEPVGEPGLALLAGVAFAPLDAASDPAARRGLVIPRAQLLTDVDVDLAPHDLVDRADGSAWEVTGPAQRWRHPMTGWAAGATTEVTQLVADGPESVRVFASIETIDPYGSPTRRPSDVGVVVDGITVEPLTSTEDSSRGQEAPDQFRIAGTGLDGLDAFAEVEWPLDSGRRFDVIGPPTRWPWPMFARCTVATIRER